MAVATMICASNTPFWILVGSLYALMLGGFAYAFIVGGRDRD